MPEYPKMPCCPEMAERIDAGGSEFETCPMSRMCRGTMRRANPGLLLAVPGLALLLFGTLMLLNPRLLVWAAAGVAILMGVGMLVGAVMARRLRSRLRAT